MDVEMVNPIKGSWSDVCPPLLWSDGNTYGCIAKGWVFLMEKKWIYLRHFTHQNPIMGQLPPNPSVCVSSIQFQTVLISVPVKLEILIHCRVFLVSPSDHVSSSVCEVHGPVCCSRWNNIFPWLSRARRI